MGRSGDILLGTGSNRFDGSLERDLFAKYISKKKLADRITQTIYERFVEIHQAKKHVISVNHFYSVRW